MSQLVWPGGFIVQPAVDLLQRLSKEDPVGFPCELGHPLGPVVLWAYLHCHTGGWVVQDSSNTGGWVIQDSSNTGLAAIAV